MNSTPLVAHVDVAMVDGSAWRRGVLTVKATFRVDEVGGVHLDGDDPIPFLDADTPTEVGDLPSDRLPRVDDALDVVVLGAAYGQGASSCEVSVAVGERRHALRVTGDRVWVGEGQDARIGPAAAFERMPLTWDRAFGGTSACLLDAHSPHDLSHPINPLGRGFDAARQAEDLGTALRAPAGYPRLVNPARHLPNLEHPDHPVRSPDDEPAPWCWATTPLVVPLRSLALAEEMSRTGETPSTEVVARALALRGHPCWELPAQPPGTAVSCTGLTPEGWWGFSLPDLAVLADYTLGARTGSRRLTAQQLVLLPESRRFYIVYRELFTMAPVPGEERCFRVRCEGGATWPA